MREPCNDVTLTTWPVSPTVRAGSADSPTAALAALGLFLLIQFVPYGHNHTQPASHAGTQMGLASDPLTRSPSVLRLSQQPHQMALVLERRARILADPT